MSRIVVSKLSKIYHEGEPNEVRALDNVSFSLKEGDFVIILGPSGAGKSTLLNILGGMDVATSGSYKIGKDDVTHYSSRELTKFRRKNIGFVFQFYNLIPNLTALENVEIAASVSKQPLSSLDVMEKVGLLNRISNFPSQLSGGEQQRTAIARAVVKNPELLLCDEPTGALDSKTGRTIIELLYNVCKRYKKTVVIVTHNSKIAECAEHLIRLSDGKISEDKIVKSPLHPHEVKW